MTATLRRQLREALRDLGATRGVLGALLADRRDGIVVASTLDVGLDADAVAVLAGALVAHAAAVAAAAGHGAVRVVHLQTDRGWVCAAPAGEHLLVAVADQRAPVGPVRASLAEAAARLSDL